MVSNVTKLRLLELKRANAMPYHAGQGARSGMTMWVGTGPKIRIQDSQGNLTDEGRYWVDIGGAEPVRFQGELRTTASGQRRFVEEGGQRHILQKLAHGPNGPE